ncbi:unnamed protein product [Gongylonema pulchrum]|uniref:SER_THR_PHOSPHATASE domain-containing protein n=1 Tax=Gongylonema pulchrum TaxID=637853 RepID=A0A183CUF3_9BILA|nr:unnamed protein product [Gongylonema pulchrum]
MKGGRGHVFGAKAIEECAARLNMQLIIRTHTPYENGYFMFGSGRMLTVWSANCRGVKLASTVCVDPQMRISMHCLTPVVVKTISAMSNVGSTNLQKLTDFLGVLFCCYVAGFVTFAKPNLLHEIKNYIMKTSIVCAEPSIFSIEIRLYVATYVSALSVGE